MTDVNESLVVPEGEDDFSLSVEPTIATETVASPEGLVVPEGEEAEVPKKVSPLETGESLVEPSLPSGAPQGGTGLDSPLSVDNQEPFNVLGRPTEEPLIFRSVSEEKAGLEEGLVKAKDKQNEDPLAIIEGSEAHRDLEAVLAPRMTTEEEIESTLTQLQADQNVSPQQLEAAEIMALQKKDLLLERFRDSVNEEKKKVFKSQLRKVKEEAGDSVGGFIDREKRALADNDPFIIDEVKEEYDFNRKIDHLTSKYVVNLALTRNVIPHNVYVKIAAMNRSKNKDEELANYKKDLLDQISKDNEVLGNRISAEEIKSFSQKDIGELAAISGSLAEISEQVSSVEAEKQEFLAKKHKGIDSDIAKLKKKIIDDESLNEEDKQWIREKVAKKEKLKDSFYEKDGSKAGKAFVGDIKEGSHSFNLYREILEDIPEDLSSKEKFDLFYITLNRVSKNKLKKAGMIDEDGNYDNSSETALRDLLGIEDVLGIDFRGSMIGGLTPMKKEALETKGKVDDLTNLFLNNTAYSSGNYWDEFYASFLGGLYPDSAKAAGVISDTQRAGETVATLSDFGITEDENINKEHLQAFSDLVAFPEETPKLQLVGSTLGGSFAMMGKLMAGGAALRALKVGKLGASLTRAEKALSKTRAGKIVANSIKQGVNAEFSGELFNDKEELEFKQFFAGQMAADVVEGMLKGAGGKFASTLIKNLGVNKKAALDFTGKIFSRATGEFTEESMQQIVGAYNKSDSFKGTVEELRRQFPDMDSVTEFAILTGLMGATFGLKTSYSDVRQRLKDGGYDTSKADEIMEEIGKETKKAAEIINEGKKESKAEAEPVTEAAEEAVTEEVTPDAEITEEAVTEEVTAPEVIIDETGETEYTNKEGEFFSEEEILNITPEEVSEMVIKNPSEAVQQKVSPKAEIAEETVETVPEAEIETKTDTDESVQPSETKTEDKTKTVQAEEVAGQTAVKPKSGETTSQDKAWAINEIKDGVLDSVGNASLDERIQLPGLTYSETKKGANDIRQGKLSSLPAKKVFAAMAQARVEGEYKFDQGSGKNIISKTVPIDSSRRVQTEEEFLSEEDLDAFYGEKAVEQDRARQVEEARISLADKVRKLKIKKPGSLSVSLGPDAIWDGAVEVLAKSIEGASTVAQAVEKAIDYIKATDWYKKQLPDKRAQVVKEVRASLNDVVSTQEAESEIESKEKVAEEKRKEIAELEKARKAKEKVKDQKEPIEEKKKPEAEEFEAPDGETVKIDRTKITQTDPKRKKKLRQHYNKIKSDPSVSQSLKDVLDGDPRTYYDTQTNVWQVGTALELVNAFARDGGLDSLLEDVENNFAEYGAVGIMILQSAALHYESQGRESDAEAAMAAKIRLMTIAGQVLQSAKITLDPGQLEELSKISSTVAINIRSEIKEYRDSVLSKKVEGGKTKKEEILQGITSLEDAINVIAEGIANNDPAVQKAIEQFSGKSKVTKSVKPVQTPEYKETLRKEREKRKQIRADAKKNKGKYFYSSFGVTPEGIEMIGDLAASYVRSGITNVKMLADKIRQVLKEDFDVEISDADIEKSFKKKNISSIAKTQESQAASEALAKKVVNEVKSKGSKTVKAVDALVRTLFSKAKESLPEKQKDDTTQSYREKLVEAMSQQEFSREVWDSAKRSVSQMLDAQESNGEITGAEKAQVLKDLDLFFEDKVGSPFSKSLLDKSIKEQIKSDGDRINEIIKEHWTNKKERGRSLAEKIVADTNLTAEQATELSKTIEDRFSSLIQDHAERALAKSLGVDKLTGAVKLKHGATLKNIVEAINLGALTPNAYLDAFGQRFGFGTITKGEVAKINGFIYNLTMLPKGSSAREKEMIRLRSFLENIKMRNASTYKKVTALLKEFFIRHILGSLSPVVRSVTGLAMVTPFVFFMEAVKNPKLFLKEVKNIAKAPYNVVKKQATNTRLTNAMFEGIKKDGWNVLKDAYKEGFVNYDIAQEGFNEGATTGFLDELHNTPWSEVKGPGKKVLKAIETPVSMMVRLLIAGDALADAAVRPFFALVGAYNKVLIDTDGGTSVSEKEFWHQVDEYKAADDAAKEAAEAQAEVELQKLKDKGVPTKDFNLKQRAREIQWEMMDADVRLFAERKAGEIRLGNDPTGSLGVLYNSIKKFSKKFPPLTYLLPFVRIPTNALQMATDYTPVGALRSIFGTGTFVAKSDPQNKTIIEKARVGKDFLKPFRKSQQDRKVKGGLLMDDRLDYLLKSSIGMLAGSTIMYLALDGLNKDDDDEDNRFQITAKGKGYYGDNIPLERGKSRTGVRPYHFRMKVPFTNTWSPWIDYRDSPLIMWMTAAGSISDRILYEEKELIPLDDAGNKLSTVFDPDIGGSAALEALASFKEQAYMQAVSELIAAGDKLDTGASQFVDKTTGLVTRSAKGTWYPSFYSKAYQYYQTVKQSDKSFVTKARDSIWENMYQTMAKDVFFLDFMLDDYINNAGEKVQRNTSAIPIVPSSMIKGVQDYVGQYGADQVQLSDALLEGRPKISFSDLFPDAMRGKTMVYSSDEKKEISLDDKMKFAKAFI